ncbi:spore cortex-lytic enzyme SleC [Lachnospiraceae bacterium KM106-2]|nr:spore cortex-lytic enzyme SleC [Lachnospiraceae bacterium KM106-2]
MEKQIVYPAQTDTQSLGRLKVNVTSIVGSRPITDATVSISYTGDPDNRVEEVRTNVVGQTEEVELSAPSVEFSLEPVAEQPYSEYNITISAPGFETLQINGSQILPTVTAVQNAQLLPLDDAVGESEENWVIPPHTLFGEYPPKIAEAEIKPTNETGEIVLSKVVIPEFVVVHAGPPSDRNAQNYYVKYKDYIKNVASSEIYATWPEATIQANVLAIQSFTLNRVYTEWYRNKGYNFTITNSTAYDHFFVPERNIFEPIDRVVDTIFSNYLSRPNVKQPILTQYCDGRNVQCPRWMTQWGSKTLGEQGYSAIEILRNYYGSNMFINTAEEVAGIPASYPGGQLEIGSNGESVRQIQNQLNVIARGYPLIPKVSEDGVYGERTAEAVEVFQEIFGLDKTGIVDYPTWYKISEIYVGVSRIAELV